MANKSENAKAEKPKKEKTQKERKPAPKKLITIGSTQMWSPVKDIKDGIVITKDGQYVQIMEFSPINFQLLPEAEQRDIADAFGAAIRTFPKRFHIKVLSRKADIETHVKTLQNCLRHEKNRNCRIMQQDAIKQIQSDAVSGVSRRFFIAFPYEAPNTLRSPQWADIRASLHFTASHIWNSLSSEPCNNELLSQIGDTDHIVDILYNCMCRSEAAIKSSDEKIADIICAHMVEHGYNPNAPVQIPINDFLAPKKIDPFPFTYTEVDGKFYSFGYIHQDSYPTACVAGWLTTLVNLGEGIDLDIWVEQKPTEEISSKLTYSMQISESDYRNKSQTSADIVQLEHKMESEQYIRRGLTNGQNFLYFSIMISVVADSPEQLKAKFKEVQNIMTAYDLNLRPCHGNHDLAFKSSIPLCSPEKSVLRYANRNILTGDFGAAYPFTSYEINDPDGIYIGKNKANGSAIFLDFFDRHQYSNGNFVILGGSGSGKTYAVQDIALLLRRHLIRTVVIVPDKGHEYRRACSAIAGTFISLAPGSVDNINIMEIRKYDNEAMKALDGEDATSNSILAAKISQIHAFFSIIKANMTQREKQILDEAAILTYKNFGMTFNNKSLLHPKDHSKYKPMPILGDLDNELKKIKGASGLREALSQFITGSARSFNAPTNVNMNNDYVVIDVSSMPKALMPIAIFIANDFVYDNFRADRIKPKALLIDELQKMVGPSGSEEAGEFVLRQFKTIRAFNGIIGGAAQDTNDFFALNDGYYGKGILANAKIKMIMKQEPDEVKTIAEKMNLTPGEARRISRFERGTCLLVANRNHVEIEVKASNMIHELITTDAKELEAILNRRNPLS